MPWQNGGNKVWSPPSRGAWIEMGYQYEDLRLVVEVAPLAGGVD